MAPALAPSGNMLKTAAVCCTSCWQQVPRLAAEASNRHGHQAHVNTASPQAHVQRTAPGHPPGLAAGLPSSPASSPASLLAPPEVLPGRCVEKGLPALLPAALLASSCGDRYTESSGASQAQPSCCSCMMRSACIRQEEEEEEEEVASPAGAAVVWY
jgi:hypothetical protein